MAGTGVTVGDRQARLGPAGAAPEPPSAASPSQHDMRTHVRYTRACMAPSRPLWRLKRAAATAAAAAVAAAATPGTRVVWPPPPVRSATRTEVPVEHGTGHQRREQHTGRAFGARVRGLEAAAHLPAIPKPPPAAPWRGGDVGQRARLEYQLPAAPVARKRLAAEHA